ncbi:hypothetical protein ES288_A06G125400v1 [Gossypium darwinii]|uniref:Peptidase S54 rhomboid domain-containing protein n=1 Tax=Gossypium darwinii TaxID=34276 RepID=A0A5D2G5W5_GOSDA|nr:hypothetical protein ES288_A06G125400v1 [Gossypium darwinii]
MLDLTENPKLVSFLDNFKSGRLHTLITSAFSHIDIQHIVSNMIGLYFFGYNFLARAIGGSVFYLVHHAFLAKSSTTTESCFGVAIQVHIMHSLFNDFYINRLEKCIKIL